jgi:hypothetical protein
MAEFLEAVAAAVVEVLDPLQAAASCTVPNNRSSELLLLNRRKGLRQDKLACGYSANTRMTLLYKL